MSNLALDVTPQSTVAELLRSGARALEGRSDSPRLDAELLLGLLLGRQRSGLIAHGDDLVPTDAARAFAGLIDKRHSGSPIAYLTGIREFWSLELDVTPAVLVPRPETELLVELALELLPPRRIPEGVPYSVLDLGTGSGAIALALAAERPEWRLTGVDISAPALEVAAGNSRKFGLLHIDWRLGSWFEPVAGRRFDLIVANPPYVAAGDPALEKLAAEPAMALAAGPTGLEALSAIVRGAAAHLQPECQLILEHGADQAPDVAQLLERHGFSRIRSYSDFSGKPRVTLGAVHSTHQEPL
ncbi:MAG TPA: peptide chain release factor N(5)-glutamine methyltransferase [Steroidobacteraceae bacterium]|nr:peptide chain release factor N(5)-glutamine methyltransferase [Steroidobacteraceae bacterium]